MRKTATSSYPEYRLQLTVFIKKAKVNKNQKNALPWVNNLESNEKPTIDYALKLALKSILGNDMQTFIMLINQVTKELRKAKAIFLN